MDEKKVVRADERKSSNPDNVPNCALFTTEINSNTAPKRISSTK